MTNAEFARDKDFTDACHSINLPVTKRQAGKFRRKRGLAYEAFIKTQNESSSTPIFK